MIDRRPGSGNQLFSLRCRPCFSFFGSMVLCRKSAYESRGSLEEQLAQENQGLSSYSVTAAQFLQERMIRSPEVTWETSACAARGREETASIAVSTKTQLNESGRVAHTLDEGSMSRLSRRRLELELGPGGDHDVPYSFAKAPSLPQVLAWMRLLAKVHRGEIQP